MTGKNVKIRIGAAILRCYEVSVNESAGEIDETDGESGGFGDCDDTGVQQAEVTFKINWRVTDGIPPVRGSLWENVLIAWDGNVVVPVVVKRHFFPKLKVLSVEYSGQTRGKNEITVNAKSSGPYLPPGVV